MTAAPQQPHLPPQCWWGAIRSNSEQCCQAAAGAGESHSHCLWPGRSLPSSGLESQTLAVDVHASSNCCTTHGFAGGLAAIPRTSCRGFWGTALDPGPGCYSNLTPLIFSQGLWRVQPAASEGPCEFTGQLPPACSPRTRDMSTAAQWPFSPGELCSPLSKYLCSTVKEPGGRQEDRLACESSSWLGKGPLPQPLALPVPISNSRRRRRGMRLICF